MLQNKEKGLVKDMRKNVKKFYQSKRKENDKSSEIIKVKNANSEAETTAEILVQNRIDYTPKVSVVMPVYNVEEYLKECLDSVTKQSLKEIEIICVDDGSTDGSLEILKEYASKDKRITLCEQSHIGSGKCRNIALSLVKGEYIGFVDPDDFIEKDYFQKLYNATIENSPDIVFQTSRIEFHPTDGRKIIISTPRNENEIAFRLNVIQSAAHLWSKIFKADFVNKYNLRNSYTRRSQDTMFTIPAILFAKEIKCIDNAQYYYRKGHISVTSKSYWMEEDVAEQFDLYRQLEEKVNQYKPEYAFFIKYKRNSVFKKIYKEVPENLRREIADKMGMDYFTDFDCCLPNSTKTIAIKNPAPDKIEKIWWGDYWLGLDLEQGLKQEGFNARLDCFDEWKNAAPADINFVIRGPRAFNNFNYDKINILYLMSIVKSYEEKELDNYDIIIVASERFKKIRKDKKVFYLPQCTNPERFYQEVDDNYKTDILFIGNAYNSKFRTSVKYCVNNELPITIYGKYWENLINDKYIKGTFVDNNRVHKYYSNAAIVLNDTTDEMRENGIISNRIFDVTACKGFIISDYVPEIKKAYGDSIPMYKNEKEFVSLVRYYLEHPQERRKKAQKAYEITMANFTNKVFAEKLHKIINSYKKTVPNLDYKYLLSDWYKRTTGKDLDLYNPKTYNEKLQWLKLYNATPIKTRLADKYLVRDWVKEKIGEEYLIPLLGVYDKFDDIDFDKLPEKFVIKCNHGSGWNIIVKDKSQLNLNEAKEKLDKWMGENFAYKIGYELHYRDIKPKIIIEKYIDPAESNHEIQVWCFNKEMKFISVESIKDEDNLVRGTFYPDGKETEFQISPNHYHKLEKITDQKAFDKAKELALKMLVDVPYVRIDFIEWKGSVLFREMTFTSGSGLSEIKPDIYNEKLGNMIKLPKYAYNMDTKKYYRAPRQSMIQKGRIWYQSLIQQAKEVSLREEQFEYELQRMRVDIKNIGNSDNAVETSAPTARVLMAPWLKNAQGSGQIVASSSIIQDLSIKIIKDGTLRFEFRGQDKRNAENKRVKVWIDYKSIKIDGKEILEKPVLAWHDEPYRYEMEVKDGQVVNVEIEQTPHKYQHDELISLLKVFYPDLDSQDKAVQRIRLKFEEPENVKHQPLFKEKFSALIKKLKQIGSNLKARTEGLKKVKVLPQRIMKLMGQKKNIQKLKPQEIVDNFRRMRVDIKNMGGKNNKLIVSARSADMIEAPWLNNAQGNGLIVESSKLKQKMSIKIINDGVLRFVFRGKDRRNRQNIKQCLWVDYTSIKIDGNELLSSPLKLWHDTPYLYEMEVKDGQTIKIEIEQSPHEYTKADLKSLIKAIYPNLKDLDNVSNKVYRKFYQSRGFGYFLVHHKIKDNIKTTYVCNLPVCRKEIDKLTQKEILDALNAKIERAFALMNGKIDKIASETRAFQDELKKKTEEHRALSNTLKSSLSDISKTFEAEMAETLQKQKDSVQKQIAEIKKDLVTALDLNGKNETETLLQSQNNIREILTDVSKVVQERAYIIQPSEDLAVGEENHAKVKKRGRLKLKQ